MGQNRQVEFEVSFRELYRAWCQCQRRKAGKAAAQRYEMNLLENLFDTEKQLCQAVYQPTIPYSFVTQSPKLREIHAACFRDRVVHHWLVPRLETFWEPWFIHDVYSNRKHKGTHKAVQRLQKWMRKADTEYFLQLDIKNFFYSISHHTLLNLLNNGLKKAVRQNRLDTQQAEFLFDLSRTFVCADYRKVRQLNPAMAVFVPPHKQLGLQPPGQGLPIGNLTSQFFANVYMNLLDQYIKHDLKCRYYLRFVDDFILLSDNRQQLEQWYKNIKYFLYNKLSLQLRSGHILQPNMQGADFPGYIIRPWYVLVRKRVVSHLKQKLAHFQAYLSPENSKTAVFKLDTVRLQQLRAVLASYLGHFKHTDSLNLVRHLWRTFPWLDYWFRFESVRWNIIVKYQPPEHAGFNQQLAFFRHSYPWAKLCIQKGRQTVQLCPDPPLHRRVRKVIISQQGFNAAGIRQRCVTSMVLY